MSWTDDVNRRLDKTRIYIVGSDEWTEAMVASYHAASRWLSIENENADEIVSMMEAEIAAVEFSGNEPWPEQIARRKKTYQFGKDFDDGDNQVQGRFLP